MTSNNLRQLTLTAHRNAERQKFTKILLSGNIDPDLYHTYLLNQYYIYKVLEEKVNIPEVNEIKRHNLIYKDIKELEKEYNINPDKNLCGVTKKYINYIENLDDNEKLLAHIYVRHFGDMSGGQIIKKQIPGNGNMYDFDDPEKKKQELRKLLNDNMASEANICFDYATQLFKELIENE